MAQEAQLLEAHSNYGDAYEAGTKQIQVVKIGDHEMLVHPEKSVVDKSLFKELLVTPLRTEQHVIIQDAESFAEYINKFGDDDTAIFVDEEKASLVAILDYHRDTAKPRHCAHTATYTCPQTKEWNTWLHNSGKRMSQEEFALFIEDNAEEITSPSSAEMLEIASTLKADINTTFRSSTRLDNGQVQFNYNENLNGTAGAAGQLEIPQEIKVVVTPFRGGPSYTRTARFRYRIKEGQLVLWYDLVRPHRVIEVAVSDTLEVIKKNVKNGQFYMGRAY